MSDNLIVLDDQTNVVVVQHDTEVTLIEVTAGGAGAGVPSGGLTGEVLAKLTDSDYDTEWLNFATSPVTLQNKIIADLTNEVHANSVHHRIKNATGITITKGQPVRFVSYNTGAAAIDVVLADNAIDVSIGLAEEDILTGELGPMVMVGVLNDVDTSAYTEGTILYVNGAGLLTPVEPTTGFSQPIALVYRSHASNGTLHVQVDYPKQDADDVRYTGTLTAITVRAALDELNASKATTAQGALADSATQPGDNVSTLVNDIGYLIAHAVDSVNGQTGTVVLTTTNIAEGTNLYYTEGRVDLNSNVAANTSARHTHSNKAILDATTASFLIADETKLDGLVSNVTTDLGYTASPTNGVVTSSDGTDATLTLSTTVNAGLMTPAQFDKVALLSGTNTGDQDLSSYDTHIADGTIHFTQAAISITKTQISDFNEADYATGAEGDLASSALQNIVEDVTPQLGADLDVNGNNIIGVDGVQFGGGIVITGGNATGITEPISIGGGINLTGGDSLSSSSSFETGTIRITGGEKIGDGGSAGDIILTGGEGSGTDSDAGDIKLVGGHSIDTGNAGAVILTSGNVTNATSNHAGSISLRAGTSDSTTTGHGGDILLKPGRAASSTDGAVIISPTVFDVPSSLTFTSSTSAPISVGISLKCPSALSTMDIITLPELTGTMMLNLVEDVTPQLGADLDCNTFNINGITPTLDAHLTRKDYVDAKTVLNWTVAQQLGNGLPIPGMGNPAVTALNGTDVAWYDTGNDELRTYRFDGTNWAQVGTGLSIVVVNNLATIAALNETDIAYIDDDNDELRTYRFDGTNWAQVGISLSIPGAFVPDITALNGTDIAFIDSTNEELRTYRFDGTNWAQVGNSLPIPVIYSTALTTLNETDIAYIDGTVEELRTYRFDGTNWAQVGNSLPIAGVSSPALATLNETDVAFIDSLNDQLRTYRFDETNWVQVGDGLSISSGTQALAALNGTDIAFTDTTNDELRTYRFGGTIGDETVVNALNAQFIVSTGDTISGQLKGIAPISIEDLTRKDYVDDAIATSTASIWSVPELVGNGLPIVGNQPSVAALNGTDVAFIDSSNDELRTYRFDGTNWAQEGNGLPITTGDPALAALNGTDVAFIDSSNDELRTYRFDGTNWAQEGNGLPVAGAGSSALAALNGTDVAFIDSSNDELRTYRFDGTNWAQLGNSLPVLTGTPSLTALNGTDVAFIDTSYHELRTYRFDGTNWAQEGNGLPITGAFFSEIAALNGTDIALVDDVLDELRTYRFDGTDWAVAGDGLSIPGMGNPALTTLNGTDVVFIDSSLDDLRTYRFATLIGSVDFTAVLDERFINTSGDTLTGQLKGITPVDIEDLTRKDYVDTQVATKIGNVVEDTTPQLGGDLDVQTNSIITADNASGSANSINVLAGDCTSGGASADGGGVNIYGGNTNGTGGLASGGHVRLNAGDSTGLDGDGGYIYITAGDGGATSDSGGWVTLVGGACAGGAGGSLTFAGGEGGGTGSISGSGGDCDFRGGNATGGGGGGDVTFEGGSSISTAAAGHVEFTGGTSVDAPAGDITFTPGQATGTGSNGALQLHTTDNIIGQSELQFWNDTNTLHTTGNQITLKAPACTSDQTITLPEITGTMMLNVVEDTTPQLGGDLDTSGFDIKNATDTTGIAISAGDNDTVTTAGSVTIKAQTTLDAAGTAGDIVIEAGGTLGTKAGDVIIQAGSAISAGTAGKIKLIPGRTDGVGDEDIIEIHGSQGQSGQAALQFWNHTNTTHTTGNQITLKAPATTVDRTWVLPDDDPATVHDLPMTTDSSGNLSFKAPDYIHVQPTTVQTLGTTQGAVTAIDWDTTPLHVDTATFTHEIVTNPSRVEVETTGRYEVKCNLSTANGSVDRYVSEVYIRVNGTTDVTRCAVTSYSRGSAYDFQVSANLCTEIDLSANDYIEIMHKAQFLQTTPSCSTVVAYSELNMKRIG